MADDTTQHPPQTGIIQQQQHPIALSMETVQGFEALQRAARLFAASDLVPKDYRGNIPNCTIAISIAMRMRADPLMVVQNLHIIHGRPGWSSAYLIACVNTSGRFTPLRYEFVGTPGKDDYGCRAIAKDLRSGDTLVGTTVTIDMAKKQGWYGREGSKWSSGLAEQMLRYRAASFWTRIYAPEISMGFQTADEIEDVGYGEKDVTPRRVADGPPPAPPPEPPPVQAKPEVSPEPPEPPQKEPPPPQNPEEDVKAKPAQPTLELEPTPAQAVVHHRKRKDPKPVSDPLEALKARLRSQGLLQEPAPATAPEPPVPAVREPGEEG